MFGASPSLANPAPLSPSQVTRTREIPPPTPIKFPDVLPRSRGDGAVTKAPGQLVHFLRTIQRPTDVKIEHLEALGLHVITNSSPEDIIPEQEYLPSPSWLSLPANEIDEADAETSRPLNNGRPSPGAKTYVERVQELSAGNAAAFRTIRRLPAPPGEINARLGNAYEFFKNLELLCSFWDDTSQVSPPRNEETQVEDADVMDIDSTPSQPTSTATDPLFKSTPDSQGLYYHRTGTGSQTPPDFRNGLLSALVKLVAYDFGCNVSHPRVEPRLYITPPPPTPSPFSTSPDPNLTNPPSTSTSTPIRKPAASSFPTNLTLIYRTPLTRAEARIGIVEGPLATLSSRPATFFSTPLDSVLDLARETASLLVCAQHRFRDSKSEPKLPDSTWWCHAPRWGGGLGGPIGREAEKDIDPSKTTQAPAHAQTQTQEQVEDATVRIPVSRERKRRTMTIYDNYRMVRPPSSTWDRKAKYMAIGKVPGARWDEVFLVSALNHHVAVVRARVSEALMAELEGEGKEEDGKGKDEEKGEGTRGGVQERDPLTMYRSRWYDMFIVEDRVEAMTLIWGMMAYLMRRIETDGPGSGSGADKEDGEAEGRVKEKDVGSRDDMHQ